jgi:APA family basic amino acid/polyamine antiporter
VRAAFLTGWFDIAVSTIGAAAVALGFGGYLDDVVSLGTTPMAITVLIACGLIAYIGVRETAAIAIAFTLAEAAGLILVIAVGLPNVGDVDLLLLDQGWVGVLSAGSLVYFAYQGFEEIATLSEETIDPRRNIPRAIVVAVIVTTTLYVLVAIAAVSSLAWEQLAESDAPLADVMRVAAGDRWADAITAIALFATFNTVLLLVATGARISYGMSRRRLLPAIFGRVSATRRTPWVATLVITVSAILLASSGDIGFIAQVTNFAVFALFAIVNAAVIALRRRRPEVDRPFRLPGAISGIPVIAVVGLLGNLLLAAYMDGEAFVAGVVLLGVGLAGSVYIVRYERQGAA